MCVSSHYLIVFDGKDCSRSSPGSSGLEEFNKSFFNKCSLVHFPLLFPLSNRKAAVGFSEYSHEPQGMAWQAGPRGSVK